jgi:predicted ArsR family transcriptional regulator
MSDGLSDEFKHKAKENAHPVRGEILQIFAATTTPLSMREISKMIELPINQVHYHLKVLEAIGELRFVGEEPRIEPPRETVDRFYAYR